MPGKKDPDPISTALDSAPLDDEPVTEEEEAAVAEAREDAEKSGTISHDEAKRASRSS